MQGFFGGVDHRRVARRELFLSWGIAGERGYLSNSAQVRSDRYTMDYDYIHNIAYNTQRTESVHTYETRKHYTLHSIIIIIHRIAFFQGSGSPIVVGYTTLASPTCICIIVGATV